jgi:hypothetical protein
MRVPLALAISLVCGHAHGFDFKGIELGAPTTTEQVRQKLGVTCGKGAAEMQVCNGYVTVAREPADLNLVIGVHGVVQRMHLTLSPDAFEVVAPELIGKFGNPTNTDRRKVQNRMGATFEQVVYLWAAEDGSQVLYSKYASRLDRSSLYFSTKADRDLLGKSKANRAGDI